MKYKIGDRVKVREDLIFGEFCNDDDCDFALGRNKYRGKIVTILKILGSYYIIKEDNGMWSWSEDMFEGLAEENIPKKEFILTQEFINNGAIHCNTKEEYNNMINWFKNNNIEIDLHDRERGWDYENLYIAYDNTFCNSWYICVSDYSYNDKSCNYDIVEWTDYMSQDIKPKEIETKTEDKKEIVEYEDIDISMINGYALNFYNKEATDRLLKEDKPYFLYLDATAIKGSDLPNFIAWLQKVNTYREQTLAETNIEYVDFQTALEWMKQGNKAKIDDYTYYIKDNKFKVKECTQNDLELRLYQIESKEWILIK